MRAIRICCLLTAALAGCSGGRSDSAADPTPLMAHARAVATDVFAGNASDPGIAGSDGVSLPAPEALPKVETVVPVIAVRQRLIPWERDAIATALEIAGMSPGEIPASAMVLPPEEFAAVNSQLTVLASGGDTVALDSARYAYALAFPLAAHPIQWEGGTFFPAMVFAVPRANEPDDEDVRIDLLRFLLALFVVFPAQQGPAPAAPNCAPPIPNTAQAVHLRTAGGDKVWFGIGPHTALLRGDGGAATREDFRVGRRAAGVARYVAESYPSQALADTMVVD